MSELFRDRGILVNSNVNKDLFSGINTVKSYLSGAPKLYVFRNCVNLIRELKTYAWGEGERPVKKDDHCADALRYYVMSKPTGKIAPTPLTPIQMDKERLAKIALRRNSYLR